MLDTAEHAIPVSGNEVVSAIQQRAWQDARNDCRPPRPTKLASDEERCFAPGKHPSLRRPVVCQNVKRRQFGGVAAEPLNHRPASYALKRSEPEHTAPVVSEEELKQAAAQSTNPVVEHEVSAFPSGCGLRGWINHVLILMNMFTENVKPRKRGRPPGPTPQGTAARDRLYGTATQLIAARGYEATTLRDIAKEAGVSVGLLYRYFPSKQAVVIALYDELSSEYAKQAASMPSGRWRDRFLFALKTSLDVLKPHQMALRALTPVMVGDPEEGIFSASTAFSRLRVQRVFEQVVTESSDAPKPPLGEALGRLLYLVHLAVLLWWLLDKSPNQRATAALVSLTQQLLPSAGLALRVPPVRKFVISLDELVREALFGSPVCA